jgi:hypothetical protein
MSSATEKLLRLADEAELKAAAYRMAAAALNGHAVNQRAARSATVLDDALAIDAARRKTTPKRPTKYARTGEHKRMVLARRARTAQYLDYLKEHGPLTAQAFNAGVGDRVGIAPLLNAGTSRPSATSTRARRNRSRSRGNRPEFGRNLRYIHKILFRVYCKCGRVCGHVARAATGNGEGMKRSTPSTYDQQLIHAARGVARLQRVIAKHRRAIKAAQADLKHERKILRALANAATGQSAPSRLTNGVTGYARPEGRREVDTTPAVDLTQGFEDVAIAEVK